MKLELTRNADNKIVGYKLIKESTDDTNDVEYVRDMIFYGLGDQVIEYNGRVTDKETGETIELKWATKAHRDEEKIITDKEIEEIVNQMNKGL